MKNLLLSTILTVGLTGSASASVLTGDLTNGLVAYYSFDGNVNDSSGNGHNAQTFGDVNLTEDRFGCINSAYIYGERINGVDPSIWGTGINLADRSLSISFWINEMHSASLDDYGGIGLGTIIPGTFNPGGEMGKNLHIYSNNERIRFSFFYDDFDVAQTVPIGTWTQLCFTYNNSNMKRQTFINGILVASNNASFGFSGNDIFTINGKSGVKMDDVGFWNTALSSSQVSQLYSLQSVPEPSTYALFGIGAIGMLMVMRRKKAV